MEYILWIDDKRHPLSTAPLAFSARISVGEIYIWARDVEQAVFYVKAYGVPKHMYLDHDLGQTDVMSFLKWLSEEEDAPPGYTIISQNPEGAKNIQSYMESWKKSIGADTA